MNNRITERVVFALPFVFVALCCIFAFGCASAPQPSSLNPHPSLPPELECRAKLLEPFATAVASDLIDAARNGGSLSEALVKSLHEVGVSVDQVSVLVKAWERCGAE